MNYQCEPKDVPCYPHSPPDWGVRFSSAYPEFQPPLSFRGSIRNFRLWLKELR